MSIEAMFSSSMQTLQCRNTRCTRRQMRSPSSTNLDLGPATPQARLSNPVVSWHGLPMTTNMTLRWGALGRRALISDSEIFSTSPHSITSGQADLTTRLARSQPPTMRTSKSQPPARRRRAGHTTFSSTRRPRQHAIARALSTRAIWSRPCPSPSTCRR